MSCDAHPAAPDGYAGGTRTPWQPAAATLGAAVVVRTYIIRPALEQHTHTRGGRVRTRPERAGRRVERAWRSSPSASRSRPWRPASSRRPRRPRARRSRPTAPLSAMSVGIQAPVGYFDPLKLAEKVNDKTLLWFRAAEIKHCRVAMAAFAGCVVTGLGVHWPGAIDMSGTTFESLGQGGLLEAWDKMPFDGKQAIVAAIGGIESVFEAQKPHYVMGGTWARSG